LNVMSIINEPTAAALAYGFDTLGADKTVLVYDLGGGTFDVTVMRISGDTVTMLATDGDVQLGGKDWDERLIDYVAEQFLARHGIDPREDYETLQGLYTQAEQAKLRLSKLPATRLAVHLNGTTESYDITREQFESMTEDLLLQTETTLQLTVQEAGLSFGQIDECLLVGGSTRMRSVRAMLKEVLGTEPKLVLNPDECVAQGAAIHAVMMQLRMLDQGLPVPIPQVREEHLDRFRQMEERLINSHTLGILALNKEGQRVVAPIIPRRAFIPRREVKTFRTSVENQQQIRIVVMEGEGEDPEACVELGMCLVRGLPSGLPKGTPIEVSFHCSHDGQLSVTARLPTIDQVVQTVIERTMGMSEEAIEASRERLQMMSIE
ncbi:MAG TPA: Hsp70 family protein, partial [Candidatus Sumerlaeota bacterium]|nr:Hsp70 family protein [Candidatus Sumerlaeota bacterium]